MDNFIPGQRWMCDAEPQLGLGTVMASDLRTVTVLFLASGETRTYAKQSAPLTRVAFAPGDEIQSHEGWQLRVEQAHEQDGLLCYQGTRDDGQPGRLEEGKLDNLMQLNRPSERLFNGQIDSGKWFELRYATLQHGNRLTRSELSGLTGARTELIPHQLYIAHEVANRYAPRVLLADEVGLGKTIEAGLILHHQLLTERARRVLIVVPESLVHQWLVEMLRRFNLAFSVFDEERCQAIEESSGQDNPFSSEQLVLCSLDFLVSQPTRAQQALQEQWDLLVVDEAHHLQWSPELASVEYQLVEQLATRTQGVLLLTATPEQLGKQGHFARLRLLDPDRFPTFDQFVEEEAHYQPIVQAVETLLGGQPLTDETLTTLQATLNEGDVQPLLADLDDPDNRLQLIEQLLDRHGTGRVLFRNTRAAIQGFPQRKLHAYPLPLPAAYQACLQTFQGSGISEPQLLLCPELLYQSLDENGLPWQQIDPRVNWLQKQLKQLRPHKVLVITASAETALDLAEVLRVSSGLHAAVFHEGMSMLERDRASAFFADSEAGSQVLICSEIGSEGRNFQFAHHMVLFDLPLNPDLLEQRIGRLDRIGQRQTINIHVPYLENSPQAVMAAWYHQGLNAFEQTCPAGHSVFAQVKPTLLEALHQIDEGIEDLPALIATTQQLHQRLNEQLHNGRDRLLEYSSCRPHIANQLKTQAEQQDQHSQLFDYLEQVFDCYGVDTEEHGPNSYIIRPSEQMQTSFPGLLEEGMTITCHRATALSNEDMHYLTWEHPMVVGALEMVLANELGNTALIAVKHPALKPGTLLMENNLILESGANSTLHANRYLPPTGIRVLIDANQRDLSGKLSHELLNQCQQTVDSETANKVIRAYTQDLREMIRHSEKLAQQRVPEILALAHQQSHEMLNGEINRLKALKQINPTVRDEELAFFEQQLQQLTEALEGARLRLDASRVVVAT